MDLPVMLREALELQVLEQEPERAATVIGQGVADHGPSAVAQVLLEATAFAFRRMVTITDEVIDLAELLTQLALDGAVPEHRLELLTDILTTAAATWLTACVGLVCGTGNWRVLAIALILVARC